MKLFIVFKLLRMSFLFFLNENVDQWKFISVISLLLSPLQVLKVRLNLQQAGTYNGVVACARSIYRHESMSSFYRGFKPSILCMIPYAGVECAVHQVRHNRSQRSNAVFIWKILSFTMLLIAVNHELGKEGSSLQQWLQTVFLHFCGLRFWTNDQLPTGSDKDSAASTR